MAGHPIDALLAVTYRCNARCTMCNIWRTDPQKELSPRDWSNIPSTLRDVNISGGEPFLRDDLPELVSVVRASCPKARIIISTNGIGPRRIEKTISEILKVDPAIGVGVSLDGVGGVHDSIRGVKGAYEQAVQTVRLLKDAGVSDLRVAFTAMEENSGQMKQVYDLSRELGVEFSCVVVHDSEVYFRVTGTRQGPLEVLTRELSAVAVSELKTFAPKRWGRSYFYRGLTKYTETGKRTLPCMAGEMSFFIDPKGEVYPCNVLGLSMGNIQDEAFAQLWDSERARKVRKGVAACLKPCWMMCSVRPAIRKNPMKVALWVAKNKARVHMGRKWTI